MLLRYEFFWGWNHDVGAGDVAAPLVRARPRMEDGRLRPPRIDDPPRYTLSARNSAALFSKLNSSARAAGFTPAFCSAARSSRGS